MLRHSCWVCLPHNIHQFWRKVWKDLQCVLHYMQTCPAVIETLSWHDQHSTYRQSVGVVSVTKLGHCQAESGNSLYSGYGIMMPAYSVRRLMNQGRAHNDANSRSKPRASNTTSQILISVVTLLQIKTHHQSLPLHQSYMVVCQLEIPQELNLTLHRLGWLLQFWHWGQSALRPFEHLQ